MDPNLTQVLTQSESDIQKDVWQNLRKLNQTFLQDDLRPLPLLGGDKGLQSQAEGAYFTGSTLPDLLFGGYSNFLAKYPNLKAPLTRTGNMPVLKRDTANPNTSSYVNLSSPIANDPADKVFEYNFTPLLKTSSSELLANMNKFRELYNFLDTAKYTEYIMLGNGTDNLFVLNRYNPDDRYQAQTNPVSRAEVNNEVRKLFGLPDAATNDLVINQRNTNQIVVRRLMLLYELMAHIKVALAMFDAVPESSTGATMGTTPETGQNELRLLQNLLGVLITINNQTLRYTTSRLGAEAIGRYNRLSDGISATDGELKENKRNLAAQQIAFETEKDRDARARRVFFNVAILTLILLVIAFGVVLLPEVPDRTKVVAIGAIFVLFVVIALVVRYVFAKTYEYFGDGILYLPLTIDSVISSIKLNKTDIISGYHKAALLEASRFLNDTINIGYDMSSTQIYGSVNNSMQKELNYFSQVSGQVKVSTEKVSDLEKVTVLSAITNGSNIMFVLYIAMVLVLTLVLVLATPGMEKIHTILYWVAGIVLVFIALFYFLNVLRRVRTDAKQYYWSQPNTSTL